MPAQTVNPSELISRFLLKDDLRPDKTTIKPGAFMPPASNLRLSVFRVDTLFEDQIWAIATEKVEPHRGPVIGRGDLSAAQITENKLKVAPDADATSRHSNVVDWPADRDERATIAKRLAALASPAKLR